MPERHNLYDLLRRRSFDHAVICTYTFGVNFFEDHCLEKLNSLNSNANINVLLDGRNYTSLVLGPEGDRPKQANLRYLLHPIRPAGAFHPKLFLFASKRAGLLVIGSANFTKAGLTSNAELVGVYTFDAEKDRQSWGLFQDAFKFIATLSDRYGGTTLQQNIAEIARDADWLEAEDNGNPYAIRLIHNLDRPLWDQLKVQLPKEATETYVLSRYFDKKPVILDKILQSNRGSVQIYTQNGITTMTSDWLGHSAVKGGKVRLFLCSYDDDGHFQPLHAKAMFFRNDKEKMLVFGSANFTTAALCRTPVDGNVEILLLTRQLPRSFRPERLFDPSRSAVSLNDAAQLQTAPEDETGASWEPHEIELVEASLEESTVRCVFAATTSEKYSPLVAKISFSDRVGLRVHLLAVASNVYTGALGSGQVAECNRTSAAVQIEGWINGSIAGQSNTLLLINLQDIQTGGSARRERRIREAQQTAAQFGRVLKELLEMGDDATLLLFLANCDIPVINAARLPFQPRSRFQWDDGQGMRAAGERNLQSFRNLHDAAMTFMERHMSKLVRHSTSPTLAGIANFLHIALAIGGVIRSQIDRAIFGFQAASKPLTIDEWFSYRKRLDQYCSVLENLLAVTNEKYIPSLIRDYPKKHVVELVLPDKDALLELYADLLRTRDRVADCCALTLKVISQFAAPPQPPRMFPDNYLSSDRWPRLAGKLRLGITTLESLQKETGATSHL